MSQTEKKALGIKTKTVQRLAKELELYEADYEKEAAKFGKLKESGADEHDVKYAEKLLGEASMMIPDTRQRLTAAVAELTSFLEEVGAGIEAEEEVPAAQQVLASTQAALAKATAAA